MGIDRLSFGQVSRFILEFSAYIGLKEVHWQQVNQFRLTGDLKAYARTKARLYALIELNMSTIEAKMGWDSEEFSDEETVIIRSVYIQHKDAKETVGEHIDQIGRIMKCKQIEAKWLVSLCTPKREATDDNLPF